MIIMTNVAVAQQTIHASKTGDNFTTMDDIVLLMYILTGLVITKNMIAQYENWCYRSPWQMNVVNEGEYLKAREESLNNALWWIRRMHILSTKGLGEVPANVLDSSLPNQTTQERWNVLQLLTGLTDIQRTRVLLHFDRLYGVQRSPIGQLVQ